MIYASPAWRLRYKRKLRHNWMARNLPNVIDYVRKVIVRNLFFKENGKVFLRATFLTDSHERRFKNKRRMDIESMNLVREFRSLNKSVWKQHVRREKFHIKLLSSLKNLKLKNSWFYYKFPSSAHFYASFNSSPSRLHITSSWKKLPFACSPDEFDFSKTTHVERMKNCKTLMFYPKAKVQKAKLLLY